MRQKYRRKIDQYQDVIAQLYPELFIKEKPDSKGPMCRTVTFQVTDACNLACTYCYQCNKGTRRMSFETAKKFIDLLLSGEKGFADYVNPTISPAIIIEFIGGEPFLEIDLIDQICDYFISECIRLDHPWLTMHMFSICSNGILYFSPKVQDFLAKHHNQLSFSITIDGNKELHDACRIFPDGRPSYDIAVAGAKDWMSKGYYMGSKITIAPGNLQYLYQAIMHMIDLGYNEINANCVFEKGWELHHATEFYWELKKIANFLLEKDAVDTIFVSLFDEDMFLPMEETDNDNWCGGTGMMLASDPDGNLYPCLRYMESSVGTQIKPLRIGNIDEGLGQNTEYCDTIKCLNCITRRSQSTDECFYCPIAKGCAWCSAYNYQECGSANKRATYICEMHKARALANAYLWGEWYKKCDPDKHAELYVPAEWALKIIPEEEWNLLVNHSNIDYKNGGE